MNRFFLNQILDNEIIMIKDRAMVHQMRDVLKLRKGEKAVFFNANPECLGFDFIAELKNIEGVGHGGQAVFMFREKLENIREPSKKLILYQSLIKKDKFEWVVQKCTELGVSEFVPIISERSEKKDLNMERLAIIAKEAAEQSGRGRLPKLQKLLKLQEALESIKNNAVVFDASGSAFSTSQLTDLSTCNLFIGPEGGWTSSELELFKSKNIPIISIGNMTLRAETAAIAVASILLI